MTTPFKDIYTPLNMYEELQTHLQEMIEIGAILKSNSPWVSAVSVS